MLKKLFASKNQSIDIDTALCLMRVFCGYAFVMHGWGKIQHPFDWMGPNSNIPGFFQMLAAVSEFVGGIGWMTGTLTRFWSFMLACTMTVAVGMHAFIFNDPFINPKGGSSYELALVYFLIAVLLLVTGPGRFSVDAKVFGGK